MYTFSFPTYEAMVRWLNERSSMLARFQSKGTSVLCWPSAGVSFVDLKYSR